LWAISSNGNVQPGFLVNQPYILPPSAHQTIAFQPMVSKTLHCARDVRLWQSQPDAHSVKRILFCSEFHEWIQGERAVMLATSKLITIYGNSHTMETTTKMCLQW